MPRDISDNTRRRVAAIFREIGEEWHSIMKRAADAIEARRDDEAMKLTDDMNSTFFKFMSRLENEEARANADA